VKIDCQEKHSFQPFVSNETNSARTKIFQTMVLIKEENAMYISHPNSKTLFKFYRPNYPIFISYTTHILNGINMLNGLHIKFNVNPKWI